MLSKKQFTKKPEPTQVRCTGDWSGDSKLSSIQNGYWEDPFFIQLNRPSESDPQKIPKRTALICRGYCVRFLLCDYYLKSILDSFSSSLFQIVSLGCGMDTTYFRLESDDKYSKLFCKFFEIDFPSVILRKKDTIQKSESLQNLVKTKLVHVEADLRNLTTFRDSLNLAGFDFDKPTLFFSECVVNYLIPKENDAILQWIAGNVQNSIWLAYEQCYPDDAFGKLMTEHFNKNGCPIQSIETYDDMRSQRIQLELKGFKNVQVWNVWDSFVKLSKELGFKFPDNNDTQQFDEYESFIVTCLHYSIRLGSMIPLKNFQPAISVLDSKIPIVPIPSDRILTCELKTTFSTHCSIIIKNHIWLIGGTNQNGRRLSNLTNVTVKINEELRLFSADEKMHGTTDPMSNDASLLERIHCAATFIEQENSIYIFGGRKSPKVPCTDLICVKLCQAQNDIESVSKIKLSATSTTSTEGIEPCSRWRHSLTSFTHKNGNCCLFLFGGKTEKETLGDSWIYNSTSNSWCTQKSQPSPRHSHSACLDARRESIFIVGGMFSNSEICDDTIWQYTYNSGTWFHHHQLDKFARKVGTSSLVHKDNLLILGGYGSDSSFTLGHFLTIINLETQCAQHYELSLLDLKEIFLPFGFTAHILQEEEAKDYLVILGGGGNCFSFGTHYNKKCLLLKLPLS